MGEMDSIARTREMPWRRVSLSKGVLIFFWRSVSNTNMDVLSYIARVSIFAVRYLNLRKG